jgi:hypothetical protein
MYPIVVAICQSIMSESGDTNILIAAGLVQLHHDVSKKVEIHVDPIVEALQKANSETSQKTAVPGKRRKGSKDTEANIKQLIDQYLNINKGKVEKQAEINGKFRGLWKNLGWSDAEENEREGDGKGEMEEHRAKETLSEFLLRTFGMTWAMRILESVMS